MTLRIGSLFSGYGGLDLAVAQHYGAKQQALLALSLLDGAG